VEWSSTRFGVVSLLIHEEGLGQSANTRLELRWLRAGLSTKLTGTKPWKMRRTEMLLVDVKFETRRLD